MYGRFDIKWLKDPALQDDANVDKSTTLSDKEKNYLKKIPWRHKMRDQLPRRPSPGDYRALVEAYGGTFQQAAITATPFQNKATKFNQHSQPVGPPAPAPTPASSSPGKHK